MSLEEWVVLDRIAIGLIRLSLSSSVAFNTANEKITVDLMAALEKMYEKPSASNKIFVMKRLFNMKMVGGSSVTEHLNNFNTVTNQLSSVGIKFDDEVRALLLLSLLLDSWNGLVTAVSKSSGNSFKDVVGLVVNKDVRIRANEESSSSTLHVEGRRDLNRSTYASKFKSRREKSKSGETWKIECWGCKE